MKERGGERRKKAVAFFRACDHEFGRGELAWCLSQVTESVVVVVEGGWLTGGLYQEAQSIHLDRTSKSSNSSLGPRD